MIHVGQIGSKQQTLMNTVMNLLVPLQVRKSVAGWRTAGILS